MQETFDLPDLGEGLTEAEILEWRVAEGDTVTLDEEIVEVSTAKAVVVIPSPYAGIVAKLHGAAGDILEVGSPLISFTVEGDEPEPGEPPAEVEPAAAEPEVKEADTERSPNLVGYGVAEDTVDSGRRRRNAAAPAAAPSPAPSTRPLAKPPVRKLAKDLGVDLADVPPTGPGETITRDDVLAAADGPVQETQDAAPPAPAAETAPARPPTGTLEPVRGIRRSIAERMEAAGAIPAAAASHEAGVKGLLELHGELAESDDSITPFAVMLRLVVSALREVPTLNGHYTDEGIRRFDQIHLGFAAATDRGLLVPVIRDADQMGIGDLNAELRRLATEARNGSIAPTDLVGSTFTVSNFGALGIDGGVPMINHPEVGILGVGRFSERARRTKKGKVRFEPTVNLTLSFDHRVADGTEAARFLLHLADRLASKGKLLGSL